MPLKRLLKCSLCDRIFNSYTTRWQHTQIFHRKSPKSACLFCGKLQSTKATLNDHLRRHLQEKWKICNLCGKESTTYAENVLHVRSHTGEKPYKCKVCGKSFSGNSNLYRHEMRHRDNAKYKCVFCGKEFAEKYRLKELILQKIEERWYPCEICFKGFASEELLRQHLNVHERAKFECDKCEKVFKWRHGLLQHNCKNIEFEKGGNCRQEQGKIKENLYECVFCMRGFKSRYKLSIHIMSKIEEKPFSCNVCQMKFSSMGGLKQHKAVHQRANYYCNLCDTVCKRPYALKLHKQKLYWKLN